MDEELEAEATRQGVSANNWGDGSNGDALAALFKNQWWATVEASDGGNAVEYGPYGSRESALRGGLGLLNPNLESLS